jgi:hypothetical protein
MIALLSLAIDIKHGFSIILCRPELFGREECHVVDAFLFLEADDGVEEVNEQIFVGLGAEEPFEAKVRDEVNVTFWNKWIYHGYSLLVYGM